MTDSSDSAVAGSAVEPDTEVEVEPDVEPEPLPLLVLRDGLSPITQTPAGLAAASAAIAGGTGPVAIDAERASGYRYSGRAYLVQLRREGAGTWLVDPIPFDTLAPLQEAIGDTEWILHAATQDLSCLAEVGLRPSALFDTELAGRLLGYPRVGLGTLVEVVLGRRMKKEHSASDWSRRPLPQPWLEYAALDVEGLVELRDALGRQLVDAGKDEWARQEFEHLLSFEPHLRVEPWRRTSGTHRIRGRRGLAAVRALWGVRDAIARRRDVTPGRILPDSAIIAAAQTLPPDRESLLALPGFHGRGAQRYAGEWAAALSDVLALDESELPARAARLDGPPSPRAWADRDPVAARRLASAREAMTALSEEHEIPVENLLTPDLLRRVLWSPPAERDPVALADGVRTALSGLGARPWQTELTVPVIVRAVLEADQPPPPPEPQPEPSDPASEASDAVAEGLPDGGVR